MNETKTCASCGNDFARATKWSRKHWEKRRFCSRACRESRRPDINRDFIIDENGCHNWAGHIDVNGYGKAFDPTRPQGRRIDWAHRIAYRRANGEIPAKHEIDHLCQNTRCINPDHLEAVTRAQHATRTFDRLGRADRSSRAAALRNLGLTYAEIAEAMGMSSKTGAHSRVMSAIAQGLVSADDLPPVRRLSEEDRRDIQALSDFGVPNGEIASWYGVHQAHISRVISGASSHRKKAVA